MKNKDLNKIAAFEKAIAEKYGDAAIVNPKANWDEEKEKKYLAQVKELYEKQNKNTQHAERVDLNGIKVAKKLLNRESLKCCSVCGSYPKKSLDDVCLIKYDCCNKCYIKYVDGRTERWIEGWRPDENHKTEN